MDEAAHPHVRLRTSLGTRNARWPPTSAWAARSARPGPPRCSEASSVL